MTKSSGVPIPTQGRISLKCRFLERLVATLIEFPSNFPLSPLDLPMGWERHLGKLFCFQVGVNGYVESTSLQGYTFSAIQKHTGLYNARRPILINAETIAGSETLDCPERTTFMTGSDTDWLLEKETISRPQVPALLGNKSGTKTREMKSVSILCRLGTGK